MATTTQLLSPARTNLPQFRPVIMSLRPRDQFNDILDGVDVYRYDNTFNPNNERNVSNYVALLLDVEMSDTIVNVVGDYTFDDMVLVNNFIVNSMMDTPPDYLDKMVPIYNNVTKGIPLRR